MRLQSINQKLVMFESGKLDQEGLIQLRRDAHTIKGSAQMLGVQDIAEVSHLFEDVVEFVVTEKLQHSRRMLQFLFDLHDALQQRLQVVDAKVHLNVASKQQIFQQLKTELAQQQPSKASKTKPLDAQPVGRNKTAKKPRKRSRVPKNLIAAVMGSIEGSLETAKDAGQVNVIEPQPEELKPVAAVDFRPDKAGLEAQDSEVFAASGKFLRIDQMRVNRLSNQIIELASDRYQQAMPQQQLQAVAQDVLKMKALLPASADKQSMQLWHSAVDRQVRQIQQIGDRLAYQQKQTSAMLDDLRDQVFGLMLRPVGAVFSVFPRAVRDIAKRSGKDVQLLLAGDAVEMDQRAAEALIEPLIHLLNNAVAHGIELPEYRQQCGKPVSGQITIITSQKGRDIHIDVVDDGRGMDTDLIRRTALERGLITATEAGEMGNAEIIELIFHPGFSTSPSVDDISGRGMGMAIVADVIRELTGSIHVCSEIGKGTQFHLTVPVSVAVQKIRVFRIAKQCFGMLDNVIRQIIPLQQVTVKKGHGAYTKGYISYEGHRVPIVDLHHVLPQSDSQTHSAVMTVEYMGGFLGIMIDDEVSEKEMLVREVDPYLKRYQPVGLMGCTIDDDGSVLLLVDPNGLKEMWRTAPDHALASTAVQAEFNRRMMLVDDSSIALKIEKTLFENMGFVVDTAIGAQDVLSKIALHDYDLLVTDLEMPDMDGKQLIEHLREQPEFGDLPILIVATKATDDNHRYAQHAGANAYLLKSQLQEEDLLMTTLSGLLGTDG